MTMTAPATVPPVSTIKRLYRIEKKAICFFRFILEGYDGIAILETLDAKAGIIALHIAPGCEYMVEAVIADLSGAHLVEALNHGNDGNNAGPFTGP